MLSLGCENWDLSDFSSPSDGLECYSCDSISDENCATLKLNTTAIECSDSCAIWIDGVDTYRGCESNIPSNLTLQHTCDVSGCNQIIFPDDRIKCVKCSADDEFCTTPNADHLYPCQNYEVNDFCYTYIIGKKILKKSKNIFFYKNLIFFRWVNFNSWLFKWSQWKCWFMQIVWWWLH